ncbi:MAG TPA: DUF6174 domain-containing protein [Longimicrobium sp.]|nr:DUF6174 domain-containing protein [Longimicrobium sp.]
MKQSGVMGLVVACLAALAACGDATGVVSAPMELERARGLWNARGVEDYRMTVRMTGAWAGGAAEIQVRDGVPVSVQPVGLPAGIPAEAFREHDTVEELFAILQHAVDHEAEGISAEYHPRLGVPVDVYIDHRRTTADDEHGFIVESFDVQ